MTASIIALCPGQGAQRLGMGRAWFDAEPAAARVFVAADDILHEVLGRGLADVCFNGPEDVVNRTDFAQPALFVASVASLEGWKSRAGGSLPALAASAGLSLGEYTALHLAGAISFADALRLVALRGRAMQDAAESSRGGMVAVIGADEAQATAVCAEAAPPGDPDVLVPANFNAPGQIVLSGTSGACDRAVSAAEKMGLRATRLAVAGAFHSPLMKPAADRLRAALAETEVRPPTCPVVSNVTARPHGGPDSIRERLVEQLTAPVRWDESCRWLAANVSGEMHELAPGKVLSGLMRRIDRAVKVESHDEP
ncbi:MAG: ACP S-malonyltransferase [Phycisphaerales bacterium]|nr:ACP S-malonyltransferase [Phycisphaerales bacterium]